MSMPVDSKVPEFPLNAFGEASKAILSHDLLQLNTHRRDTVFIVKRFELNIHE